MQSLAARAQAAARGAGQVPATRTRRDTRTHGGPAVRALHSARGGGPRAMPDFTRVKGYSRL